MFYLFEKVILMDEELVSKKDLLELTGISYGQLYRWKRKNLVPESWFVRKSTFTGQETFFPKEKILARIDKIKNMKEDISLDDMAEVFSPLPTGIEFSAEEIISRKIISEAALAIFPAEEQREKISFQHMLFLFVVDKLLQSGDANLDEAKNVMATLLSSYSKFEHKACELFFIRKLGVAFCFLSVVPGEIQFEENIKVVARIEINSCVEELKIKIS